MAASINLRAPRTSNATDHLTLRLLWNVVTAAKVREEILRWVWITFAVVLTTKIPSRGSAIQNVGGNESVPHGIVDAFGSDARFWERYLFWGQLAASLIWFFVVWFKNRRLTALFVTLFKPHWLMTCVCYGIALLNHFLTKLVTVQAAFWVLTGFILLLCVYLYQNVIISPLVMISAVGAAVGAVLVLSGYNVDQHGTVLLLGLCFTWDSFKIVDTYGRIIAATQKRIR